MGKIIFKTIWNIFVFVFIILLFPTGVVTNDIAYTVLFNAFLYPLMLWLIAYHTYNCITYYVYCYKHRENKFILLINIKAK